MINKMLTYRRTLVLNLLRSHRTGIMFVAKNIILEVLLVVNVAYHLIQTPWSNGAIACALI
jgi:hypothetical protein